MIHSRGGRVYKSNQVEQLLTFLRYFWTQYQFQFSFSSFSLTVDCSKFCSDPVRHAEVSAGSCVAVSTEEATETDKGWKSHFIIFFFV